MCLPKPTYLRDTIRHHLDHTSTDVVGSNKEWIEKAILLGVRYSGSFIPRVLMFHELFTTLFQKSLYFAMRGLRITLSPWSMHILLASAEERSQIIEWTEIISKIDQYYSRWAESSASETSHVNYHKSTCDIRKPSWTCHYKRLREWFLSAKFNSLIRVWSSSTTKVSQNPVTSRKSTPPSLVVHFPFLSCNNQKVNFTCCRTVESILLPVLRLTAICASQSLTNTKARSLDGWMVGMEHKMNRQVPIPSKRRTYLSYYCLCFPLWAPSNTSGNPSDIEDCVETHGSSWVWAYGTKISKGRDGVTMFASHVIWQKPFRQEELVIQLNI